MRERVDGLHDGEGGAAEVQDVELTLALLEEDPDLVLGQAPGLGPPAGVPDERRDLVEEHVVDGRVVAGRDEDGDEGRADRLLHRDVPAVAQRTGHRVAQPAPLAREEARHYLESSRIDHLIILGVAAGACVRATALGALHRGYRVTLVSDAIGAPSARSRDGALAKLLDAGAAVVTSDAAVRSLGQ